MKNLMVLAIAAAALAYFFYEPLPEGWQQPWKTRYHLASYRLLKNIAKISNALGLNGIQIKRNIADTLSPHVRNSSAMDALVTTQDIQLDGVPVRLYKPKRLASVKKRLHPGMVYYHGGGWTIGSVVTHDLAVKRMVHELQVVAISVEYRLAPEHKYPIPFDDCLEATKHFLSNSKEFGVENDRILLAGDSAGGNLAATISLKLRDTNFAPKPKLQVLIYPCLQLLDFQTPSRQANRHGPYLTEWDMGVFSSSYVAGHLDYATDMLQNKHVPEIVIDYMRTSFMNNVDLPMDNARRNYVKTVSPEKSQIYEELKDVIMSPYVSPLFADDLRSLPPAYITACENDPLRDDSIWYTDRLRRAGVEVKLDVLHCFHAWNLYTEELQSANDMLSKLITYVKRKL